MMKKWMFLIVSITTLLLQVTAQSKTKLGPIYPVKGTWITNVGSDVLKSKANIDSAVALCKKGGLNHIFVVVWNKGETMYPSEVVEKYTGVKQDKLYVGRDPMQEIVDAAHRAGIRVHAWFEFGFSYAYGDSASIWSEKYPHWVGRKVNGQLLQKNEFFWWNALHPEVQQFMTSLVLEVVKKYDFDGVQGDDRLPAMPAEGGYDAFTQQLYAAEHNGQTVPNNPKDSAFIDWKVSKLNTYIKGLYKEVKAIKPKMLVTWAPSPYPWSKEQYLQDWPSWLNGGYADMVLPQIYRYDIKAYEASLKEMDKYVPKKWKYKVYPGVLTSLGNGYEVKPELLQQMVELNRKMGYKGEVTFYFETFRRSGIYYNNKKK